MYETYVGSMSEMGKLYSDYWKGFRAGIEARRDPSVVMKAPKSDQYFQVFLPRPGQPFSARLGSKRNRIAVEFCLLRDEKRTVFKHLKAHAWKIETAIGQPIEWSDKQDVLRCHLLVWRDDCDLFSQAGWADYQRWQWEHLLKLRDAVVPLL